MGSFFATLAEIRPKPKKTRSGCELCRNLIDQLRRKPFKKKKKKISPELVPSREISGFGSEREKNVGVDFQNDCYTTTLAQKGALVTRLL